LPKADGLIFEIAVSLSKATYTPIPFWLSIPLHGLRQWVEATEKVNQREKTGEG